MAITTYTDEYAGLNWVSVLQFVSAVLEQNPNRGAKSWKCERHRNPTYENVGLFFLLFFLVLQRNVWAGFLFAKQ